MQAIKNIFETFLEDLSFPEATSQSKDVNDEDDDFFLEDFDEESVLSAEPVVASSTPQESDVTDFFDEDQQDVVDGGVVSVIDDFDLEKAVIYSEILNPKYF